ncbi:hypothetical protein BDV35DRAFT_368420 [Aspergillus flavus]|uniref:Uncharacterized protein n=1 Tax=Aspergillus flavus TaxID=5059 RepID=A0A5N6GL34_ASPFL|nr:hypothetical protein BDV35DRAFT_368420 [Aspergillus flavus]
MHSVTGRKGGGIIWEGKVKKETQQVACMICRYSASLTGGPRLEARNINLPESASSLPMVSAAKINTGSLVRFGLGPDRPHVLCMEFYPISLRTRYG